MISSNIVSMLQRHFVALLCLLGSAYSTAESIRVAVASNFQQTLVQIIDAFEAQHDISVSISSASSGKHYAQILHGAPFDLFFSADQDKINRLIASGHISSTDSWIYAQGKLVLFSKNSDVLPLSMASLGQANLRIAMANPKLAPYGVAAKNLLDHLQPDSSTTIIVGENIAQAFHFSNTQNADIGLVAMSQVIRNQARKHYLEVPQSLYPPILQKVGLIKNSKNKAPARLFLDFLDSNDSKKIILANGYRMP